MTQPSWDHLRNGVPFTLPESKLPVRLRPVDFLIWSAQGGMTDEMSSIIAASIREIDGSIVMEPPQLTRNLLGALNQTRELMESYARAAFAFPRVVDHPVEADEISPKWLGFQDLQFVYGLLNVSLPELIRFSEEQIASLQPVSDESIDAQPPVGTAESRPD